MIDPSDNRQVVPAPFTLGSTITGCQQTGAFFAASKLYDCSHFGCAAGYFTMASSGNTGNGTSNNMFAYASTKGNSNRDVDAAYDVITYDQQNGSPATNTLSRLTPSTPNGRMFLLSGFLEASSRTLLYYSLDTVSILVLSYRYTWYIWTWTTVIDLRMEEKYRERYS